MKSNLLTILILSLLIISSFMIGRLTANRSSEPTYSSDTVIISKRDTLWKDTIIEKTKYIPKKIVELRHDTITKDTVLTYEKKLYVDTLTNDADSIIMCNVVRGINASLDSTHISWKKQNKVITNTIYITKEKEKTFWDRFHIQPQATAGWNPIDGKCAVVVGFGIGFDL